MNLRSIKWRLQLWHGVILLLVLGGFGYTAYELQKTREYRRVDEGLHDHMAVLMGPPRRPGRPPRTREFFFFERGSSEAPGQGRGTGDVLEPRRAEPGEPRSRPPTLRPEFGRESEAAFPEDGLFYYIVWDRQERIIRSRAVPESVGTKGRNRKPGIVNRGDYRELMVMSPRGESIVVGRSIVRELKEMRRLALILFGSGGGILALGLAGGWVVATRAMEPVDKISGTAQKIASGDLTQRIAHEETESELGRLVVVLNSTFARLESAFSEQTRFTTDVSHELRTPVSVIVSQTQMALSRERSAGEYRESLEACQRAAQRMRRLIESLLQLARLDAGQEIVQKAPFDLGAAAAEAADLLRPLAQERNVTIVVETEPVMALGDLDKIGQVVTNLVSNAIHYTAPEGRVVIETEAANQLAVITVRDSGVGIPPEDLPHIFDRFYRVDTSRSRDRGGSGLGLAITRAIVHAHGGTIDVTSEPEKGSVFTVRLPLAEAQGSI